VVVKVTSGCAEEIHGRSDDGRSTASGRDKTDRRTTTAETQINHGNADSNVSIMNGNVTQAQTTTCARRVRSAALLSLLPDAD